MAYSNRLPPVFWQDTWRGFPVRRSEPPFASDLESVRMAFRRAVGDEEPGQTLTSEDGEITIDDATAWSITVEPIILDLSPGDWLCSIEGTSAAGDVYTFAQLVLPVVQDPTYTVPA